jgi:hypothetical protein
MTNISLKRLAGILTVPLTLIDANYLLELGWLGSYGKLVATAATFLTFLFLLYAIRNWREQS